MAHPLELDKISADQKTAFILGNGPSLKSVALEELSDFTTIGLNAAYRYWYRINWRPRYYACLDLVVGLSHKEEIAHLISEERIERFLLRGNLISELGEIALDKRVINFDAIRGRNTLLAPKTITTGSHAALWAASSGFEKIVLLGIDGLYKELVDGAQRQSGIELEIVEAKENPNYFFEDYQQPGDRYNLPNPRPDLHINAWREARLYLYGTKTKVLNANPHSAVRCFPFINLEAFLNEGAIPSVPDETLASLSEYINSPQIVTSAPSTPCQKLKAFALRQAKQLIALTGILGAALIASLWLPGLPPNGKALIIALFGVNYITVGGILYLRYTVIQHLAYLNDEITIAQERLRDLECKNEAP